MANQVNTLTNQGVMLDLYKIHAYIPNDAEGNPLTPFGNFSAGYEAASQHYEREIATLKTKVSYLETGIAETYETQVLELSAQVNQLREALETIAIESHEGLWQREFAFKALSAPPAESLQAHDDKDTKRLNFLDRLQERATSDMKINMSLKSEIHINRSLGVSLYIRNYKGHTESTAYGKTIRDAIDMALKEVK